MKFYLAPLQGLTDWIFRKSFQNHITQLDKTFSPFIRIQDGTFYRPSQCNDILPKYNNKSLLIPQFLGNSFQSFSVFENLCLQHGYNEANINMGCPFPMVSGKIMGAGLLSHTEMVEKLLTDIFKSTSLKISIKCRLGNESSAELKELIPIFNNYPIHEIIIHPRTGKQKYTGKVDLDSFNSYATLIQHDICYNGDINCVEDYNNLHSLSTNIHGVMIGRGLLRNPFLLSELRGEKISDKEKNEKLREFHLSVLDLSVQKYSGNFHLMRRLLEYWEYHADYFEDGKRLLKKIKKAKSLTEYETLIWQTFC